VYKSANGDAMTPTAQTVAKWSDA